MIHYSPFMPLPMDVQIKGKINALTLDACTKTGVIFDDLVAACELVNCNASQIQVTGVLPTVSVDNCDGIQASTRQ